MKPYFHIIFGAALLTFISCNVIDKLANTPPIIEAIIAEKTICSVGDTVWVKVEATDAEEDPLTGSWIADGGFFINAQGLKVEWVAPKTAGYYTLQVTVRDDKGGQNEDRISLTVLPQEKPTVRIVRPEDGAFLTALGNLTIEVAAEPVDFVGVDFYIDGTKRLSDSSPPFIMDWPLAGICGMMRIKAIAFRLDATHIWAADSIRVNIEGVIPVPKIKGK